MSNKQLQANRQNAKLSTGPKTAEGKKITSMNSSTHGFAGQTVVLQPHELPAYNKHFEDFRKEYNPATPTEAFLVQTLADLSFSLTQLRTVMTNRMAMIGTRGIPNDNETHSEEVSTAIARARSINEERPSLDTLGRYEQRKMRQFLATRKELAAIQAARKAEEKSSLEEAATIRRADPTWRPEENGFVHSLAQIDRYIKVQLITQGAKKAA